MTVSNRSMLTGSSPAPVFAIIGGGIAGVVQAIHLAEKYPWLGIHVFEKNKEILTGTSSMNPGRPTFGFHYQHLDTAIFCQENTVKFTLFLERIGCKNIFAKAPQRGIYVLMKDPMPVLGESIKPVFGSDELQPVFNQIKRHAIRTYSNDGDFKRHFGHPDKICRELKESEYRHFFTPELLERIGACYDTAEKTFDVAGICSFLRGYLENFKNITVMTEANVTHLERMRSKGPGYRITWYDGRDGENKCETAQLLSLSCWERVGLFREQLGKPHLEPTHNRLKILIVVEIELKPDSLQSIRPIFVASGPFCMISPQEYIQKPNGRIVCRCACTLAIKTNHSTVPDNQPLPLDYDRMLEGMISPEEKMELGRPILEGARQFFTCLSDAKLIEVRFGTVRVPFGEGKHMDLHDSTSDHHARAYPGCEQLGDGLFISEAMKLTYSVYNAERIMEWGRADINRLERMHLNKPSWGI
ncbi:hypothetical protein PT974_07739 [Cladobotryum mycophilum]|uniref:FAD dependent oxidoreductase domain-containing protein n=1 Tax=Cladobotryum mycophilum TaxID=491253 RepID=A0ABR0SHT9_9HYPO